MFKKYEIGILYYCVSGKFVFFKTTVVSDSLSLAVAEAKQNLRDNLTKIEFEDIHFNFEYLDIIGIKVRDGKRKHANQVYFDEGLHNRSIKNSFERDRYDEECEDSIEEYNDF